MKFYTALAFMALTSAIPVIAEPVNVESRVTTLVVVKTPPGVTREMINAGFVQAAPGYQKVPGLIRKYFTVHDTSFGGMYLWKNRADAEAWFTPEWRARVKKTYGTDPELTYYDSPLQIDITANSAK
jgi:hypothetical protein